MTKRKRDLASEIFERLKASKNVTYRLACEPEVEDYHGNASAIDDETDKEVEDWIADQLASGNDWAWCIVTVTACFAGEHGHASLGGCSYQSQESFEESEIENMRDEALRDLARNLLESAECLRALGFRVVGA
jgi:hypothetical protein